MPYAGVVDLCPCLTITLKDLAHLKSRIIDLRTEDLWRDYKDALKRDGREVPSEQRRTIKRATFYEKSIPNLVSWSPSLAHYSRVDSENLHSKE